MSKSILLDTRTTNFLEVVGNGKTYVIPPFQREYSWGEEQWEDLWNDILALRDDLDNRHYMGAMVVEATSDRSFKIIDGQQRLATISIISLVIIRQLLQLAEEGVDPEANRERAETLRNRFIGEKDPASLILTSKLNLNETDDGFYQDYLVAMRAPANPRGLPKSNRLLWECTLWFRGRMATLAGVNNDGKSLAELLNETIARQLLFIVIAVDDELNAYTVFETLNARGVELSSTDLLKNYLFSRVRTKTDLLTLQRRWKNLIATVRQERFPSFLRYHLLCELPKVRSTRLYKIVRERVRSSSNVFELMQQLEERAELFSALADASHDLWIDHPDCKPLIRERVIYKAQQSTPLMFAAWEKFTPQVFARVLKLVNAFTFRFTTVSNLNTNELEPLYHRAAKAILDGKADSLSRVAGLLLEAYVEDSRFRQNLEEMEVSTSGQGKRLAKFILCRLESDASGNDVDSETDTGSVEHIMPENPSAGWFDVVSEQEWSKNVYRLGNLTLLERKRNASIGNGLFSEKIETYANSRYVLTSKISEDPPDEWTVAQIEKRQKLMAKRAVHLWRADFS